MRNDEDVSKLYLDQQFLGQVGWIISPGLSVQDRALKLGIVQAGTCTHIDIEACLLRMFNRVPCCRNAYILCSCVTCDPGFPLNDKNRLLCEMYLQGN